MAVGCAFITCAVKKKGIEFCWDCEEGERCERWKKHREFGKKHDSFKCYQKLEDDVAFVQKNGIKEFERLQKEREKLLRDMLQNFNEGRSKSYYCAAATVLEIADLREALVNARNDSAGLEIKGKAATLHSILEEIAERRSYSLKLRK
jgi:hypothetical protein